MLSLPLIFQSTYLSNYDRDFATGVTEGNKDGLILEGWTAFHL